MQYGAQVEYQYAVTNIGEGSVADVEVVDVPMPGQPFTVPRSPISLITPSETVVLGATRVLGETTVNKVTATGRAVPAGPECMASDTVTVVVEPVCRPKTAWDDFTSGGFAGGTGSWSGPQWLRQSRKEPRSAKEVAGIPKAGLKGCTSDL